MKKASKEWAELNLIEKENLRKQYIRNYEIYTKELEKYNNSLTDEQKELSEKKKNEYDKQSKKNNKQVLIMNISNHNIFIFY